MTNERKDRSARTPIAQLRRALERGKPKRVRHILRETHPAKAAAILESLPADQRRAVWRAVDSRTRTGISAYLPPNFLPELEDKPLPALPEEDTEPEGMTELESLREALEHNQPERIRDLLQGAHAGKIAALLEALPSSERGAVWALLGKETAGEVLVHLHEKVRRRLVARTPIPDLIATVSGMALDDLVDLIQDIPASTGRALLQALDEKKATNIRLMLAYPEDSAGGLMNTDYISVRADVTLNAALRYLRLFDELPDHTDKLMVVDLDGQYRGVLRLKRLLTSHPGQRVESIMETDFEPISADLPVHDVALRFEDEDLISAPVTGENGMLLGRITIDDVVDVIRDEEERTIMGAAGLDTEEDLFAPVLTNTRRRALWLGINLVTAFLAAWVIGLFEGTLQKIVALAVLMPIVASMGGIAGSQTLTLMIRGMALGNIQKGNTALVLFKEIGIGILNGLLWSLVVGAIAWVWFGNAEIGGIIAIAILLNLICASLAGVTIPLSLRWMGIDPALAGSVVLTTVTDVVGFLAFLGLATLLLL